MLPQKEAYKYTTSEQLADDLERNKIHLIDVRTSDAYSEAHIGGSSNSCVYEIEFINKLKAEINDDGRIVVYGQDANFKAADIALNKLLTAGFNNVSILEGGLKRWREEDRKVKSLSTETEPVCSGRFELDTDKSKLRWIGRNLSNQHEGFVRTDNGFIELSESGDPLRGEVTVDMNKIECTDLKEDSVHAMLIGHLSNEDFFLTKTWPYSTIVLDKFLRISHTSPGIENYQAEGSLTVRGVTQAISLECTLARSPDAWVFQANFDLDRTRHGAIYGSGRFFERLGMHLVNDKVHIQTTLFFG